MKRCQSRIGDPFAGRAPNAGRLVASKPSEGDDIANDATAPRSILLPVGWAALAVVLWLVGFSASGSGGSGWFVFGTIVGLIGLPWLAFRAAYSRGGTLAARGRPLAALAGILVIVVGVALHSAHTNIARSHSASAKVPITYTPGDATAVRATLHYDGEHDEMSIDITYDTSSDDTTPELDAHVRSATGDIADCPAFKPWRSDGDETTVTQTCLIAWDANTIRHAASVRLVDPS